MDGYAELINKNFIEKIEKEERLLEQYPSDEKINANGQILMPGLICAHTHFYGVFSRGMAIHGEAPANFLEILKKLWWPLDQSLHEEDVYYSAMVCLIDAIKHGTTTVFDHHASPNFIDGSLDVIENAVRKSGLRASLCYEVTDRGGTEKADAGIRENLRMIQKLGGKNEDRMVTASFGLHAGVTLSDKTLEKCAEVIPEGHGFHIHVAEDKIDQKESEKRYDVNVVARLNQFKITGDNSIFVHGVHLSDDEIDTIHQTGTWLTHQPRSNMNNAVGMANVEKMVQRGIPICMGNDGFSFSMWDEWRTCYLAHKMWNQDPRRMGADQVVDIAAYNNARMATKFFNGKIGVIQEGALADLILVDYIPITSIHADNLPWHIIFGFRDSMVTMTMVNGKVLMRDRKLTEINEHEVCEGAQRSSAAVWERYKKQF